MLRRYWVEIGWGVLATACVALIVVFAEWETIPFHVIWVSLTIAYGFRVWKLRSTVVLLLGVCAITGGALLWAVTRGHEGMDEVAEVPLMAAMFLAMTWHARRRQAAIEEARRLAEQERSLLERQREFVRDASHELRTPITVATGHAELIRASAADEQVERDADVVLDELARLSRLSERLLLLAAAEDPGFVHPHPFRVGDFVDTMVRRWEAAAPRRWGSLVQRDGTVTADHDRLVLALDALIENAVLATADGDEITLAVFAQAGSLVFEVRDPGHGVAVDEITRIFERFARADRGRARRGGGTGLGLAIVKAVAEAHGGTASARAHADGGSAFAIALPTWIPAVDGPDVPQPTASLG